VIFVGATASCLYPKACRLYPLHAVCVQRHATLPAWQGLKVGALRQKTQMRDKCAVCELLAINIILCCAGCFGSFGRRWLFGCLALCRPVGMSACLPWRMVQSVHAGVPPAQDLDHLIFQGAHANHTAAFWYTGCAGP